MVDSASGHAIHVFELHPLLVLVSIPGAGLGYRVVSGGSIQKGEVLLTESSFCAGALQANSADDNMVSQVIQRVQKYNHDHDYSNNGNGNGLENECESEKYMYQGALSVAALTTKDSDPNPDIVSMESPQQGLDKLYEKSWVQQLLDNNVYQCRREPRYAALFIALSRFNHSCDPNAINDASREVATVRAIRGIQEGEEVTLSYVPVGNDLTSRTAALASFGFSCACHRCSRERTCDPAFSTQCEDCGMKVMVDFDGDCNHNDDDAASNTGDSFSSVRVAVPCLACGSSSILQATDAIMDRHAAIVAANSSLRSATDDAPGRRQILVEATLLLAPFATHPETIQLHRGLVRLLLQTHHRSNSNLSDRASTSSNNIMLEQLREIWRLEQAHGGAKHRDLNFLRCFARLIKKCRVLKGKGCCEDSNSNDGMLLMQKHIETRWRDICLLHFGESDAPATFMADTDDDEVVVQYVPIGCDDEQLALFDGDDEIDLSGHEIGDEGVLVLCSNLYVVSPLCQLDLDSNGLSSKGGVTLGLALASGAAPLLTHLDLMDNSIGSLGACSLAAAIQTQNCSQLAYLDLHGNDIGDEGCVALGAAFSMGAGARLSHLNLSANGIDDRGCASLGSLFAGYSHASDSGSGRMLAHLDLSENVFQSCTSLFEIFNDKEGREAVEASSLEYLDMSWNCIADFEPLLAVFTRTRCCTALATLSLNENVLSDRQCNRELAKLKASGATPMLEYEENKCDAAKFASED
jgi:Ran GTPase-activating protein (RanGAP) involved in mRNA processing and transport